MNEVTYAQRIVNNTVASLLHSYFQFSVSLQSMNQIHATFAWENKTPDEEEVEWQKHMHHPSVPFQKQHALTHVDLRMMPQYFRVVSFVLDLCSFCMFFLRTRQTLLWYPMIRDASKTPNSKIFDHVWVWACGLGATGNVRSVHARGATSLQWHGPRNGNWIEAWIGIHYETNATSKR